MLLLVRTAEKIVFLDVRLEIVETGGQNTN